MHALLEYIHNQRRLEFLYSKLHKLGIYDIYLLVSFLLQFEWTTSDLFCFDLIKTEAMQNMTHYLQRTVIYNVFRLFIFFHLYTKPAMERHETKEHIISGKAWGRFATLNYRWHKNK